MALLRDLSPELQAHRQQLLNDCNANADIHFDLKSDKDPYFVTRLKLDSFDDDHKLDGRAEKLFAELVDIGYEKHDEDGEWSVMEIHALLMDALDKDMDLDDTDLFSDLLKLFK